MNPLKPMTPMEPIRKGSEAANTWWPQELGTPSVVGSSKGPRYVYFADKHRLAVDDGQVVKIYDTDGKTISRFTSSDRQPLAFQTDDGPQKLASLKLLSVLR